MKANDAFPSKYIAAADLNDQEKVVKITHVAADEIGGKQKFICYFAGAKKGLVLNKTNFNTIAKITGQDDTDDWTGCEICLYPTMVDFQGEQVEAVRVKAAAKKNGARPSSADQGRNDFPGDKPTPRAKDPRDDMNDEIGF
jgi:hypothetical protein